MCVYCCAGLGMCSCVCVCVCVGVLCLECVVDCVYLHPVFGM